MIEIKCKQCRKNLFYQEDVMLLTSHNENKSDIEHTGCGNNFVEELIYLSTENIPTWIQEVIDQTSWTKGKLNCPLCNNRIGSYNFIASIKCSCGKCLVPPIRLIRSKLDILKENNTYCQASIPE